MRVLFIVLLSSKLPTLAPESEPSLFGQCTSDLIQP
jgi:hypothetical protein